jgi:hypothetical protein
MIARALLVLATLWFAETALAQSTPAPPPPPTGTPQKPAPPRPTSTPRPASDANATRVRGFATVGGIVFQAKESFDAVLGTHNGVTFGGGGQVLLPYGFYAEASLRHFTKEGERAFVASDGSVFPLGIPLKVGVTPLELTGGWRYRHCPAPPRTPRAPRPTVTRPCAPKLFPYVGAGLTSLRYSESSDFADDDEDVDDRFNGFHLVGGADYRVSRWIAVGGEVLWSSVPDALGAGGVSEAFDEDNLGGTAFRLKIIVGR